MHMDHLRSHRMFRELKGYDDPCVQVMRAKTEEGQKVERNEGDKYWAVFERVDEEQL